MHIGHQDIRALVEDTLSVAKCDKDLWRAHLRNIRFVEGFPPARTL